MEKTLLQPGHVRSWKYHPNPLARQEKREAGYLPSIASVVRASRLCLMDLSQLYSTSAPRGLEPLIFLVLTNHALHNPPERREHIF